MLMLLIGMAAGCVLTLLGLTLGNYGYDTYLLDTMRKEWPCRR
jgi:hypothetical protein